MSKISQHADPGSICRGKVRAAVGSRVCGFAKTDHFHRWDCGRLQLPYLQAMQAMKAVIGNQERESRTKLVRVTRLDLNAIIIIT